MAAGSLAIITIPGNKSATGQADVGHAGGWHAPPDLHSIRTPTGGVIKQEGPATIAPASCRGFSFGIVGQRAQFGLPADLLHSERNFLRSLPCSPLASASFEHSSERAACCTGAVADGEALVEGVAGGAHPGTHPGLLG